MFGEEPILGIDTNTADAKNRVTIPKFSKVEPGEKLTIIHDVDVDAYKIYGTKTIAEIIKTLNQKILDATTKEESIFYKKKLMEFCKGIIKESITDSQNRVVLPKQITDITNKIMFVGSGDHFTLVLKQKN